MGKFHRWTGPMYVLIFDQKFPKLNSRPINCSWLYGSYFSKIISPHCAPDDDERQGTTEWIGLIGSNNRQEIRPLPCSFALLIASTRTLIADGKNASDQLQISLSLWYNYTFLARCEWCARGHRYRTCPWLCGVAGARTQCKCILVWFPIWSCAFVWPTSKVGIHCAWPNVKVRFCQKILMFLS